jgi:hypothetical protein
MILRRASIARSSFPIEIIKDLEQKSMIREIDEDNKYTLTAKGILHYEKTKGLLSEIQFWEYIDKKYFDLYTEMDKPLGEKEKLVVFVMIAARTFSEKSSVDLKKGDLALEHWEQIINSAYSLLIALKVISRLKKEDLFGKELNLHKVSLFFRHKEAIAKKTKGLYRIVGDQRYYLDVALKDGTLSHDSLKLLFRKILGNCHLTPEQTDKLSNYCNDITTKESAYILDIKTHKFNNPEYDHDIKDSLISA